MTSGVGRAPTSKERENNKRRERKRRAIASRIFAGLRQFGNYKLPKHCDNNEVLKALCREAGWTVEDDGTTYKTGCKQRALDFCASSTSTSAASSSYGPGSGTAATGAEGMSLIPWPKSAVSPLVASAMASASAMAASVRNPNCGLPPLQIMRGGTCSAPVTPPLGSPRASAIHGGTSSARPEWMDVAGARGGESSDCAAAAFSNACKGAPQRSAAAAHQAAFMATMQAAAAASGTSTPTYPPVFCVSGGATMAASASVRNPNPNNINNSSGSPTPFFPSGASTPTRCSSLLGFNFAAGAAATLMAAQKLQAEALPNNASIGTGCPDSLARASAKPEQISAMETEEGDSSFLQVPPAADIAARLAASSCAGMACGNGKMELKGARIDPDNSIAATSNHRAQEQCIASKWFNDLDTAGSAAAPVANAGGEPRPALSMMVKAWEGERVHDVISLGDEELELTLGNSMTKATSSSAAATPEASSRTVSAMCLD